MRNLLAQLRAEKGWTQGDLAEQLRVSRQTIVSIEGGKYDPSLRLALRLARLFSLPVEEIFEDDDTGAELLPHQANNTGVSPRDRRKAR